VYDSELGVTCHWCRQKTVETHVVCTAAGCASKRAPLAFCGMCLRNRHGEDIDDAVASVGLALFTHVIILCSQNTVHLMRQPVCST
jgi:hypothetical protein